MKKLIGIFLIILALSGFFNSFKPQRPGAANARKPNPIADACFSTLVLEVGVKLCRGSSEE